MSQQGRQEGILEGPGSHCVWEGRQGDCHRCGRGLCGNQVLLKVFIYSEPPLAFPDPFLNRQRANGFIRDDTGLRAVLQERYVMASEH